MGRISDIIPPIYYDKQNDLIRFTDCLDVEVKELERKIKGITDLVNIDKCPDDKLPYLAALTNCPLMGKEPALWRRQILNWPYILRIKGTALSLEVFLNSIDVDEHKLYTFFRDAEGNLVEDKPEGAPFMDSSGLWYNIRTHYFDLDIIYGNEHYLTWNEWHDDFLRSMNFWLTRAKPFHSELRKLNVILRREQELHLFVGTATVQGTKHDIAFVPKTQSTGNMPLSVGTGTLQSQKHDISMFQHTQGDAGLNVFAGTATVQGTRHDIAFVPKTQGKGVLHLFVGTGTLQSQRHSIAIVQHTHGRSALDFKAGTATAQGIHHDIHSKQEASGRAAHGFSVGGAITCGFFINLRR